MKVRDAIEILKTIPQNLVIGDEYAENLLASITESEYDDGEGSKPYVALGFDEWE